ncbi:hypothetical protein UY286_21560 [Paenibacillus polymyxa]|uniref:hypothetical protein n=1 Tax=Paenibacillus polymyxa TaxID=1406 RepID=UPI002AB3D161|nr:hypothetical protein [Paenibacillus polymyxa]MDY7993371.1 hypothetical protein [Paenibacillus polymyxa]MDY8120028.1 hypothetical protein [Paenibacillus polymyxa]
MKIGPKVYYRKTTGEVIYITSQVESPWAVETTKEDDMGFYPQLKGYDPEQLDVLKLEFDKYTEDFRIAKSYWINPETKQIEFVYPPKDGDDPDPVPQKPLTDQVSELKTLQDSTEAAMLALMDVSSTS